MNANQEKMLNQVYAMWIAVRHVGFWLRWAFVVLFVVPSVVFCAALAGYSDFSFSRIPQDILQFAANETKYPVAQDGFLSMQTCLDPKPVQKSGSLPPPVRCEKFGIQQQSIAGMSKEAGRYLWDGYVMTVFLAVACILIFDLFGGSRRAFLASIVRKGPARRGQSVA